jgi:hypothetical protein
MAARDDGLVREENENRVVSREDTTELTEVEDVKHLGDFSDAVSALLCYFYQLSTSRGDGKKSMRDPFERKKSCESSTNNSSRLVITSK